MDTGIFILNLFQDFEKVAVVVRPQSHSFLGIEWRGTSQSLSRKSSCRRGDQHPRGAKNILRIVVFGVYHAGDFLRGMHLSLEHRLEIQVSVRDVYGENAVRPQVAEIEIHGLFGQQVDRDGVAGKCVHGKDVEILRVAILQLLLQREARVAHGDVQFSFTIRQEEELLFRQFQHQRIDLVIAYVVAEPPVRGRGARAQTDDADAHRAGLLFFPDGEPDSGIRPVVGGGQVAPRDIEIFLAVVDGAVGQRTGGFQRTRIARVPDFQPTVKIAYQYAGSAYHLSDLPTDISRQCQRQNAGHHDAGPSPYPLKFYILAPHFLNALYEMPVGLVACAALVSYVLRQDIELKWIRRWPGIVVTGVLTLALAGYVGWQIRQMVSGSRVLVRNFYGGLKVRDSGDPGSLEATRTLTHGTINHGEEYLHIARRDLPTTYYGPNTGIGLAIREKQKAGAVRIGIIGLGTGTTAAYGRLGDYVRYYEINPLVLELAKKEFFFLADCKAKLDVAMGDARLSLEQELKDGHPQNFDVLAVDAFSSDSIPVHLLTKEAMDLYFRHLRPDGILAVHISNRYLNLQPVLEGEVHATQKIARVVDTEDDDTQDVFGATWVLITSPATGFTGETLTSSAPLDSKKTVRLWTDDYSNLFKILK